MPTWPYQVATIIVGCNYSLNFDYQSQIHCCYITITVGFIMATIIVVDFQNYLMPFVPMKIGFIDCILGCSPSYNQSGIDFVIGIVIKRQMDSIR